MHITASDIKGLMDCVAVVRFIHDAEKDPRRKSAFLKMFQHSRKVYILLLQASKQGSFNLEQLCNDGIPNDSDTAMAISSLCPNLC